MLENYFKKQNNNTHTQRERKKKGERERKRELPSRSENLQKNERDVQSVKTTEMLKRTTSRHTDKCRILTNSCRVSAKKSHMSLIYQLFPV